MEKLIYVLILAMGLSLVAASQTAAVDYEFRDLHDYYKLVARNNDLYVEHLYEEGSRKITHTPKIPEGFAFFTKDAKYIVYREGIFDRAHEDREREAKRYIIPFDKDDSVRKEIHWREEKALYINRN